MTITMQNPVACTSRAHRNRNLGSLERELEKLDREAGHDYVPMDVFIDTRTMMEHFQESSIRARLERIHSEAS